MSDDLRYEVSQLPGADNSQTPFLMPNMLRLVRSGITFSNAYSNFASCGPSRQSLLTGRYPDALKVWNQLDFFRQIGSSPRTLPQYLKENGYTTVSIGKIFHVDNLYGIDEAKSWTQTFLSTSLVVDPKCKVSYFCPCDPLTTCADSQIAAEVANQLPILVKNHRAGIPFFLAVGFRKPHLDWRTPFGFADDNRNPTANPTAALISPPTAKFFPLDQTPPVAYYQCKTINTRGQVNSKKEHVDINSALNNALVIKMREGYWTAAKWMDTNLGKVLDSLEQSGVAQETAVVFMSDHGWSLGERGFWCKQSVQEPSLRIPLIFRIPWLSPALAGTSSVDKAELVDIFPTVLDILGVSHPNDSCLQGTSLYPILSAANPPTVRVKSSLGALSIYPRCLKQATGKKKGPPSFNDHTVFTKACSDIHASSIVVMGYSLRLDRYRYNEWRLWNATLAEAIWSDAGLFARELYDYGTEDVVNSINFYAQHENVNLIGHPDYLDVQEQMRDSLWARVPAQLGTYDAKFCSPTLNVNTTKTASSCSKAKTSDDCELLYAMSCQWFPGYDRCLNANFCGFSTKQDITTWPNKYNLPIGTKGCLSFASRCFWHGKRCRTRINAGTGVGGD